MKILVLAPHAYYVDRGTPICVDYLLRSLSDRGEQVDVCVYDEGEDRDYPGVTIHRIRPPRWLGQVGPGFSLKKLVADVYLFGLAWKLRRRLKPDVIHAGEEAVFIALLFKWLFGTPYVFDMDSSIAQQMVEKKAWLKPLAPLFNWCEGVAIRRAVASAVAGMTCIRPRAPAGLTTSQLNSLSRRATASASSGATSGRPETSISMSGK